MAVRICTKFSGDAHFVQKWRVAQGATLHFYLLATLFPDAIEASHKVQGQGASFLDTTPEFLLRTYDAMRNWRGPVILSAAKNLWHQARLEGADRFFAALRMTGESISVMA